MAAAGAIRIIEHIHTNLRVLHTVYRICVMQRMRLHGGLRWVDVGVCGGTGGRLSFITAHTVTHILYRICIMLHVRLQGGLRWVDVEVCDGAGKCRLAGVGSTRGGYLMQRVDAITFV